jgi:hypothetical protein
VFFRAESLDHAFDILGRAVSVPPSLAGTGIYVKPLVIATVAMCVEWLQRDKQHGLECESWPVTARWSAYLVVVAVILVFGNFGSTEFIYFQF